MVVKKKAPEPAPPEFATTVGGFEIVKAEALAEPASMLIFGHPKRGKTTLAGSISAVPGFNRVLDIDLEKGSAPLAHMYPNVDVVRPEFGDSDAVAAILNELATSVDKDGYLDSMGYDAVILDTVSTLQNWVLDAYLKLHPTKTGKPDFDAWAYWQRYAMDTMWDLHNMSAVGISLYHTKVEQNELTKEIWTSPYIQGSARFSVASVPDLVGYLDVTGQGARTFQVTPRKSMQTGSRFEDVLPETINDATMVGIYNAIRRTT